VATAYYPFNGVPIALRQGSSLSYLHHDHLGSLVALTDASGNEQWWGRYAPFGALRLTGGLVPTTQLPTDRLFTGQTRDLTSDGFYFFKARYYDATIGKFHTPDTVVPDPKNPQALNRYAYALNNPLRYRDPSGHDATPSDPTGGKDPLNWTMADFDKANWAQRQAWLSRFQSEVQSGGWFNNVAGILDYFNNSPVFHNSAYMLKADAGVLKAIQDGAAAAANIRGLPGGSERTAAAKWQKFFLAYGGGLSTQSSSGGTLTALWGDAEQAGVKYGIDLATATYGRPAGREGALAYEFTGFGNIYRWAATSLSFTFGIAGIGAQQIPFVDPRRDRGFVDEAAGVFEDTEGSIEALTSSGVPMFPG
jgi:RHS repeat-associated protein